MDVSTTWSPRRRSPWASAFPSEYKAKNDRSSVMHTSDSLALFEDNTVRNGICILTDQVLEAGGSYEVREWD